MPKKLEVIVNLCSDCPFFREHYECGENSFLCDKTDRFLACPSEVARFEGSSNPQGLLDFAKPEHPLTIPSWCPLEDA